MERKIFHEAPIAIFNEVQEVTDGDYALVHLLESNEKYRQRFFDAKKKGREIILDNSVYELGESFNIDSYIEWINRLDPDWYIIPDSISNMEETYNKFKNFSLNYASKVSHHSKAIAVPQGKTIGEFLYLFDLFHADPDVEMIGIPFIQDFYLTHKLQHGSKIMDQMMGRILLINTLNDFYNNGYYHKPVHLLGSTLPQEGIYYKQKNWIYSTDTSNPVVAGLEGTKYEMHGLNYKSKTKLHELINDNVPVDKLDIIMYNISGFREFWSYN